MSIHDISRDSILQAVDEFEELGREKFLDKYGYGKARSYFLRWESNHYDSKAIVGAAYGYEFPDEGPLESSEFSGGTATVGRVLNELGFEFTEPDDEAASEELSGSGSSHRSSSTDLELIEEPEPFEPEDVEDGRKRILRAVAKRRGQQSFRENLLDAYGEICAVTGCGVEAILEAAHIYPYQDDEQTNHVQNGLLLRADIHTLFDIGLLGIDPEYTVVVDSKLADTEYARFEGERVTLPEKENEKPSSEALALKLDDLNLGDS